MIKFIQYTDTDTLKGKFTSTFNVEETNHKYFSWQGEPLPKEHPMYFLRDLHLVDYDTSFPMHGLANMKYWIDEDNPENLANHLCIPMKEAQAIIDENLLHITRVKNIISILQTRCINEEIKKHKLSNKYKFYHFNAKARLGGFPSEKSIEKLLRQEGMLKDYFEVADKLSEVNLKLEEKNAALEEVYLTIYKPHLERFLASVERAKDLLSEHDGETITLGEPPSEDEWYFKLNGEVYPVTKVHSYYYIPELVTGGEVYYVAETREDAGEKAREYWEDLADNDPEEFAYCVGEESLISWGLGKQAGPGLTKARSMREWLDLYLDAPEEQWASYDGKEVEIELSKPLAKELGYASTEVVAYRSN